MDDMTFVTATEDGRQVECVVLFTFDCTANGKHYLVYTDNTLDEAGGTKVYASTYDNLDEGATLHPIEAENEWAMLEYIMATLQDENFDPETFDPEDLDLSRFFD